MLVLAPFLQHTAPPTHKLKQKLTSVAGAVVVNRNDFVVLRVVPSWKDVATVSVVPARAIFQTVHPEPVDLTAVPGVVPARLAVTPREVIQDRLVPDASAAAAADVWNLAAIL